MPGTREHLSASAGGKQIKVGAVATPGTLLHETGIEADVHDEIVIYANNSHATDTILLTIEFGGVASPDDHVYTPIPAKGGEVPVLVGRPLSGTGAAARAVRAFAPAGYANVLTVGGHVNRLAPDA